MRGIEASEGETSLAVGDVAAYVGVDVAASESNWGVCFKKRRRARGWHGRHANRNIRGAAAATARRRISELGDGSRARAGLGSRVGWAGTSALGAAPLAFLSSHIMVVTGRRPIHHDDSSLKTSRVRTLVRHLHNTTASALCRSFGLILIPKFGTTEMARRVRHDGIPRRLNAATCRLMYALSHYAFRIRLRNMARRFRNVKVRCVSEAYTSVTCGLCGHRNYALGGSRVYRCRNPTCAYRAGRDDNAGRLTLVKQVSLILGP